MTQDQKRRLTRLITQTLSWSVYDEGVRQGFAMGLEDQTHIFPMTLETLQLATSWLADEYDVGEEDLQTMVESLQAQFISAMGEQESPQIETGLDS